MAWTGHFWRAAAPLALGFAAASPASAQDTVLIDNVGPDAHSILIEGDTIAYNGPRAGLPAIGGARLVDAEGAYALPGLIDMHVHVWGEAELAAYLAHGVTTVRNLSGMPFHLRLAEEIEAGALAGPRLFTSGPILNSPGPNQQINHQIVVTEQDARDAVRGQAEAGYTRIKTYSNLTNDAWRGVLAEAQARGMAITGHPPEGERLEGIPHERDFLLPFADILDAGWETLEHTESIYFHALRDSWDPAAAQAVAETLAAQNVPVTATLVAQRNLVRVAQSQGAYAKREGTQWLNPVTQQLEAEGIADWAARDPAYELEKAGHYARFTQMMQQAGVLVVAGSDAGIFTNIPGASLLDELDLLAEAGFTPAQAIAAATTNAAKALGEEGRLGCLEQGCLADIVLYACDPFGDLACLRAPQTLASHGRMFDAAALHRLREAAGQHDMEQIVADLFGGLAAQGLELDPAALGL